MKKKKYHAVNLFFRVNLRNGITRKLLWIFTTLKYVDNGNRTHNILPRYQKTRKEYWPFESCNLRYFIYEVFCGILWDINFINILIWTGGLNSVLHFVYDFS